MATTSRMTSGRKSRGSSSNAPGGKPQRRCLLVALGMALAFFLQWVTQMASFSSNYTDMSSFNLRLELPAVGTADAASAAEVQQLPAREARMLKYNTKYHYHSPDAPIPFPTPECGSSPDFTDFFQLTGKVRSRFNEDKIMYELLFKDKLSGMLQTFQGTVVELGAFNGASESNSMFFEKCLGWKGLLIEGNPGNFAKAVRNRPYAHRMSFAPSCDAEYEKVNGTVQFYRNSTRTAGLPGKVKNKEGNSVVDVPCGPLAPVLQDVFAQEQRISFFSLDVEGAEPLVMATMDFDNPIIEVIMIEVRNKHCRGVCETRDQIRAKMKSLNYTRYEGIVSASDVYIHPQSRFPMPAHVKAAG